MFTMRNLIILSCVLMVLICSNTATANSTFVIEIVSGNNQTGKVGQRLPNPFVVRAYRLSGNTQINIVRTAILFTVSKQPPNAGATVNRTHNHTDSNGQASTKLKLGNTLGTYTVEASFRDSPNLPAKATFTATATPNNAPEFDDGDSTTRSVAENAPAGKNIGDPVDATDDDSTDTLTYSLSGTDASSFDIDSAKGQLKTKAALDYESGKTSYSVTVEVTDGTSTDSIDVTISVTDVDEPTLEKVSGDGQSALINQSVSNLLVVRVLDKNGDALSGVTVSFSVSPSGTLGSATATTGSNGQASTTLQLGSTSGTYTVTASVPGLTDVTFTATANSPPPAAMFVISGDNQSALINEKLPDPLVVRIVDQNDAALSGVTVSFSVSPSGTLGSARPTTGSDGQASTTLTLGSTPGNYTVTARVSGLTDVTFTATATASTQEQEATPEQEQEEKQLIPVSKLTAAGQIGFSELMLATRGGLHSLSQWIELYNNSETEAINLIGWQLQIEARDRNGVHRHAVITLEELHIQPQKTALIVTWFAARKSDEITDARVYNFFNHHFDEFEQNTNRNRVIGQVGFHLKLSDGEGSISDVIGNLDGDSETQDEPTWELPSSTTTDGRRTSLMRWYNPETDVPLDGTKANNWVLSSDLNLKTTQYWGRTTDIGNPGHRLSNAPLPVTLSHFRAQHTDDGVLLNWTTESEVDNAGFYIYRSETKDGEFKVVNPTMIQGAGTTGERNEYTWTDTTAKPNTVYYYRIEDVSFAGERQTLDTARAKGNISAKDKFVTQWGELKQ